MVITSVLSAGLEPEQARESKGRGHWGSYSPRNSASSIQRNNAGYVRRYSPWNGRSFGASCDDRNLLRNGDRSGARNRLRSRLMSRPRYRKRYGLRYSLIYDAGYDDSYGASYDHRYEERSSQKQEVRCRAEAERCDTRRLRP
jgi:hypothetical protein